MDFKISSGAGRRNMCPKCRKKMLAILTKGVKKLICSCGYSLRIDKYAKNIVDTKNISQG